jgi:hypothetical protein
MMILANAGHREQLFVKWRLTRRGLLSHYQYALTHYRYDPVVDEIITDTGDRWGDILTASETQQLLAELDAIKRSTTDGQF